MTDHASPEALSAFLRGELSGEERRALVRHLLSGCRICSSRLAGLPGVLPVGKSWTAAVDTAYDAAIERARRTAKKHDRELRRQRERTDKIVALLPREELAVTRRMSRKQEIEKIEGLLAQSWSLRHENPSLMVQFALLAVKCAQGLTADRHRRERIFDLRGRALSELGNAYRVLDQLDLAEETLAEAERILALGTQDESLRINLLEFQAAMAAARRRFGLAATLVLNVFAFHEKRGDRNLAGRALIERGLYVGYAGDPEQALLLLDEGLSRVDPEQEPQLVYAARHNQLLFIVDLGRFRDARTFRFRHSDVLRRDSSRINQAKLRGLEGRIEIGLERPERAEAICREVQQEFEELGRPYVASVVGLDLAAALLALNRPEEAGEVVLAAHQVFRALRIHREALATVLVLHQAIEMRQATAAMAEEVAAFLRRLERDPSARFDPRPV